jgi:rhodanese-related sulfurtransferase
VRSLLRQTALLLGLAFLPALGQGIYFHDKVSWRSRIAESEMVALDVARSWGANAIWVDARPEAEFERGHVPEAILLNEDRWNELLSPFLQQHWSPEKKIVVYCSAESCNLAGDVARRLREEAKLPNEIRVLKGGWEEWLSRNK